MAQSIAVNSLVALTGRAVSLLIGLATVAALTRTLGVDAFGVYSAILAYGSLLLVGADLGLYLTLTRQLGASLKIPVLSSLFSQIFWVRTLALLVVFAIGSLLLFFIPALLAHPAAWWIVVAGLAVQSISQLLMGIFQARSVVWRATVGDLVGRVVQLGIILLIPILAHLVSSLITFMAIAFTIAALTSAALHYLLLPVALRITPPRPQQWRSILRTSWPLAAMLVLNAVYFRVDMVILTLFRSSAEVGVYGLAYRIIESGLFIPAMFGGILLPHLSRLRRNRDASVRLVNEALRVSAVVGVLVAVILITLSRPLVVFFSGVSFLPSAPLLALLSLALLAMFFGNLFGYTLVAYERQRSLMWLYLGLACANVVGNLLLVPRFGALAAAATTVATEITAATIAGLLTYRLLPYSLSVSFLLRLLLAALAATLAVVLVPNTWHVIIQAALATLVFGAAALWLRLSSPREFRTLLARP